MPVIFLSVITAFIPFQATAHTILETSLPKSGAVLKLAPTKIVLSFAEPILKISGNKINKIQLFDWNKKNIKVLKQVVISNRISAIIPIQIANGRYTLSYRVVGKDGHVLNGSFNFTVKKKK